MEASPPDFPDTHGGYSSSQLTVVTLWRNGWTETQETVLRYLLSENFPSGTHFIWVAEADSETEKRLEKVWHANGETTSTLELVTVPSEVRRKIGKAYLVAHLYNEALRGLKTDELLFVEDDMVAKCGTFNALRSEFLSLQPEAFALMAAYRSRAKRTSMCAERLVGGEVPVGASGSEWRSGQSSLDRWWVHPLQSPSNIGVFPPWTASSAKLAGGMGCRLIREAPCCGGERLSKSASSR